MEQQRLGEGDREENTIGGGGGGRLRQSLPFAVLQAIQCVCERSVYSTVRCGSRIESWEGGYISTDSI